MDPGSESDDPLENVIIMKGWIVKRGSNFHTWKKRWACLTTKVLEYFSDEKCSKKMGSWSVDGISVVRQDPHPYPKHSRCICLGPFSQGKDSKYEKYFEPLEKDVEWMDAWLYVVEKRPPTTAEVANVIYKHLAVEDSRRKRGFSLFSTHAPFLLRGEDLVSILPSYSGKSPDAAAYDEDYTTTGNVFIEAAKEHEDTMWVEVLASIDGKRGFFIPSAEVSIAPSVLRWVEEESDANAVATFPGIDGCEKVDNKHSPLSLLTADKRIITVERDCMEILVVTLYIPRKGDDDATDVFCEDNVKMFRFLVSRGEKMKWIRSMWWFCSRRWNWEIQSLKEKARQVELECSDDPDGKTMSQIIPLRRHISHYFYQFSEYCAFLFRILVHEWSADGTQRAPIGSGFSRDESLAFRVPWGITYRRNDIVLILAFDEHHNDRDEWALKQASNAFRVYSAVETVVRENWKLWAQMYDSDSGDIKYVSKVTPCFHPTVLVDCSGFRCLCTADIGFSREKFSLAYGMNFTGTLTKEDPLFCESLQRIFSLLNITGHAHESSLISGPAGVSAYQGKDGRFYFLPLSEFFPGQDSSVVTAQGGLDPPQCYRFRPTLLLRGIRPLCGDVFNFSHNPEDVVRTDQVRFATNFLIFRHIVQFTRVIVSADAPWGISEGMALYGINRRYLGIVAWHLLNSFDRTPEVQTAIGKCASEMVLRALKQEFRRRLRMRRLNVSSECEREETSFLLGDGDGVMEEWSNLVKAKYCGFEPDIEWRTLVDCVDHSQISMAVMKSLAMENNVKMEENPLTFGVKKRYMAHAIMEEISGMHFVANEGECSDALDVDTIQRLKSEAGLLLKRLLDVGWDPHDPHICNIALQHFSMNGNNPQSLEFGEKSLLADPTESNSLLSLADLWMKRSDVHNDDNAGKMLRLGYVYGCGALLAGKSSGMHVVPSAIDVMTRELGGTHVGPVLSMVFGCTKMSRLLDTFLSEGLEVKVLEPFLLSTVRSAFATPHLMRRKDESVLKEFSKFMKVLLPHIVPTLQTDVFVLLICGVVGRIVMQLDSQDVRNVFCSLMKRTALKWLFSIIRGECEPYGPFYRRPAVAEILRSFSILCLLPFSGQQDCEKEDDLEELFFKTCLSTVWNREEASLLLSALSRYLSNSQSVLGEFVEDSESISALLSLTESPHRSTRNHAWICLRMMTHNFRFRSYVAENSQVITFCSSIMTKMLQYGELVDKLRARRFSNSSSFVSLNMFKDLFLPMMTFLCDLLVDSNDFALKELVSSMRTCQCLRKSQRIACVVDDDTVRTAVMTYVRLCMTNMETTERADVLDRELLGIFAGVRAESNYGKIAMSLKEYME